MKLKILLTKFFLIIAFLFCVVFAAIFLYFAVKNSFASLLVPEDVQNALAKNISKEPEYALPKHIKIPSIGVDANILNMGLTSEGAVDAPKGALDAGWFDLSSRPGAAGNAVIDGHAGYKNNKPAVFDNLYRLKAGDKIYVEDENGKIITFVVRELRSYDRNQNAAAVFIAADGGSHLNLITCGGDWNAAAKTHSKRLVVFTDKLE